jgi:general secretion pathway protein C
VAILVADGQPPRALKVGKEISDGVVVREVHPKYVMLSEGGVLKRIELATDATAGTSLALAAPIAGMNGQQPMPQPMQPPPQPPQPEQQNNSVPVPSNQPMEVPQALPPGVPPPPPQMNMPAPTRGMSGQGGQPPTQ